MGNGSLSLNFCRVQLLRIELGIQKNAPKTPGLSPPPPPRAAPPVLASVLLSFAVYFTNALVIAEVLQNGGCLSASDGRALCSAGCPA